MTPIPRETDFRSSVSMGHALAAAVLAALAAALVCGGCRTGAALFAPRQGPPDAPATPPPAKVAAPPPGQSMERRDPPAGILAPDPGPFPET